MKNLRKLAVSLIAILGLAGCTVSGSPSKSSGSSASSADSSSVTSGESSSASGSSSIPGSSSSSSTSSEEQVISYTAAEAIDAVAGIMTEAFGQTVTAKHNANGDYIVLNFGATEASTIKGYCSYFIPEGFELVVDWAEDSFDDGTPVEYTIYVCGDIALQYAVYAVSGYEGEEADYNGLYLQIDAYSIA